MKLSCQLGNKQRKPKNGSAMSYGTTTPILWLTSLCTSDSPANEKEEDQENHGFYTAVSIKVVKKKEGGGGGGGSVGDNAEG